VCKCWLCLRPWNSLKTSVTRAPEGALLKEVDVVGSVDALERALATGTDEVAAFEDDGVHAPVCTGVAIGQVQRAPADSRCGRSGRQTDSG